MLQNMNNQISETFLYTLLQAQKYFHVFSKLSVTTESLFFSSRGEKKLTLALKLLHMILIRL